MTDHNHLRRYIVVPMQPITYMQLIETERILSGLCERLYYREILKLRVEFNANDPDCSHMDITRA